MTFVLGKLFWLLAAPGNFLLLLLAVGTLRLMISRRRRGLGLVAAATAGLLTVTVLPVGEWLLLPLENRFPVPADLPAHIDGIVVLGGSVDETVSQGRGRIGLNSAGDRLVQAAELASRYPEARVAIAGGSGRLFAGGLAEATVMRDFLIARGIDPGRITPETRSRNTYENAVFAREEVKPNPGGTWILVTSAAQMPRATGCFRGIGWSVIPYPVDYRTGGRPSLISNWSLSEQLMLVNAAAKEWVGLAAYYIMGRTDALFPAPR